MFKNKIIALEYSEAKNIMKGAGSDIQVVEIDGKHIQSWEDYCAEVEVKMEFPTSCVNGNYDGYEDWMRDLGWLDKNGYIVVIYDFAEFMKDNLEIKNLVIRQFEDIILPWWQKDVELHSNFLKASSFNVYLVD